ncbi:MAG TPA: glycosyl hydrolase family 28 protein [Puia sp.]|nr:glycosyl hydrolase family 28 protein [Puia sp.]
MRFFKRSATFFCFGMLVFFPGYSQKAADGFFNIKNYGARGDGHTLDTKGINKAIAACVKAGGGTVCVPAGTFVTGTFQLFSNVNLFLSPGAVILASENTNDYLFQTDYGFSGSGAGGKKLGIIFADRAENVSVTGTGVIDGRAAAYFYMDSVQVSGEEDNKYTRQGKNYMSSAKGNRDAPVMWRGEFGNRPGTQLIFHACKRVTIRDITVRNANDWTMDLNACDNVKVLGISIDNDMSLPNSDGIDMYDSKNVIISDCDVRAGDDAIAVISTSNLKVTNCNLVSRSSGIRIGYNGFNDNNSGNLLFDNIRIYGSNRGIGIFQRRRGNMENMLFSNMIIDTRLYPGQWWGHGEPIHISALPGIGSKEVGTLSNIRFTNIIARGEEGIVLYGSEESRLRDISFDNVQLTLVRGPLTDLYAGNFDLRATNDPKQAIFKHDIPAMYARYVKGLTVKGMEVKWDVSLPDYFTNALAIDHFEGVRIEGLTGEAGPNAVVAEAVIALKDGQDASIRNVRRDDGGMTGTGDGTTSAGLTGGRKWLSQENVKGLEWHAAEDGASVSDGSSGNDSGQIASYGQRPGSLAYMTDQPAGFVQRDGITFRLDGAPYYYIGANYWQGALLATRAFGKAGRARVQRELSFLAANGVTNLRVVAGAEGSGAIDGSFRVGPSLQPRKGVFSEDALEGLDFLLSEMGKRKMKAVIYLSNNWDWSGGFLQYLNWNGLLPDSVFLRKMSWEELRDRTSQFYDCASCTEDYFRQVKKLVSRTNSLTKVRYAADPSIMAWELANEPRPMRPVVNDSYQRWVSATAALIKSMDGHHLVTTGTEGMASTGDDLDLYQRIHADRNIDYLTIHVWPKNWGFFSDTAIAKSMPAILNNTRAYIAKHEVVARSLDKPMVIEEFGLPRDLQSFDPASPASLREKYYQLLFSIVQQSVAGKKGIAGCNFWAFGGEGRPVKGRAIWKQGDSFLGDPPMEEQGLNSVFDSDKAIWKLVRSFTKNGGL